MSCRKRFFPLTVGLCLVLITCSFNGSGEAAGNLTPFAVSYEKLNPDQIRPYRMLIVEPGHYKKQEVAELKQTQTKLIAYISLGEVNPGRWYFSLLKEQGFLGKNENWGSYFINLADSASRNIFCDKVIPEIMDKGFDGLFLDTVDSVAPYTERAHLQSLMVELIKDIRNEYPDKLIIQNAGLFILDRTHQLVDAVLVESVATSYNFKNREYRLRDTEQYKIRASEIQKLSTDTGNPFLIVEFADSDSLKKLARVRLDTLPHAYFIGEIGLNNISKTAAKGH